VHAGSDKVTSGGEEYQKPRDISLVDETAPFFVLYVPKAPWPLPPLKIRNPLPATQPVPLPSRTIDMDALVTALQSYGRMREGTEVYPPPLFASTGFTHCPLWLTVNVPAALPESKLNDLEPPIKAHVHWKATDPTDKPALITTLLMLPN
jgi:hypothetical protein